MCVCEREREGGRERERGRERKRERGSEHMYMCSSEGNGERRKEGRTSKCPHFIFSLLK